MLHGEDRSADSSDRAPAFGFQNIVGASPLLREAISLATQVAGTRRTTVLLIGETGTGKELFARGIHYASAAADEPFVAINCAAIPEALLESELFGHERGAFTGAHARKQGLLELAGSGTLFLDEVHHLPRMLQPKLLRALESRQVRRLGGSRGVRDRMPDHRGGEPAPRASRRQRRVSRRPVLPPQRLLDHAPAAARPPRGRRGHRASFSRARNAGASDSPRRSRRTRCAALRVHRWPGQRARAEERRRARGDPERRLVDRSRRAPDDSAARGETERARRRSARSGFRRAGKLLDEIVARGSDAHAQDHQRQSGGGGASARHLAADAGEEDDPSLRRLRAHQWRERTERPVSPASQRRGGASRRRSRSGRARRAARARADSVRPRVASAPRKQRRVDDPSAHRALVLRRRPTRRRARLPRRGARLGRGARRRCRTSRTRRTSPATSC